MGASTTGRYAALTLLLSGASATVVLVPGLPIAAPNPALAAAVAALAAAVGLALLYLGVVRFQVFGRPLDLCAGLAFGALALANLAVRVGAPLAGAEPVRPETTLVLLLLTRLAAAGLFLAGLACPNAVVAPGARAGFALRLGGAAAAALVVGAGAVLAAGDALPGAVDAPVRRALEAGAPVFGALPGQQPWLVLLGGAIALPLLVAAAGYAAAARRSADPHAGTPVALLLLFFGHLHALLFPPVALDYVGTADWFLLAAYLVLLYGLAARLGGEIADHAARDERLRLSRELHDGLAQQLSLLHLRLARAAAPERPPERRARDLEAADRLVEGALLEARQAITALRTEAVSWQEFGRALEDFADEFAQNHEVAVRVATVGAAPAVSAQLQAELLRVVHEACSNAVRHGGAARIDATVAARPGRLELRVRDDGRGFDPGAPAASGGVGLRAMAERLERRGGALSLDSAPGAGTTVRAVVPLPARWGVGR